jgi:PIN domain nuclease of toxin-antitoxin system
MKLLLDTHTFIWWDSEPQRLSQQVLNMCQNPENVLLVRGVIWGIGGHWGRSSDLRFTNGDSFDTR